MKKVFYIIISLLLLTACYNSSKEDVIKELYAVPYESLVQVKKESKNKEDFILKAYESNQKEMSQFFKEDELLEHISKNTFMILNQKALDNDMKITVVDIKMDETGNNQYSYVINFEVEENNQTKKDSSSGSIQFDESDLISYWKISKYPDFANLP